MIEHYVLLSVICSYITCSYIYCVSTSESVHQCIYGIDWWKDHTGGLEEVQKLKGTLITILKHFQMMA